MSSHFCRELGVSSATFDLYIIGFKLRHKVVRRLLCYGILGLLPKSQVGDYIFSLIIFFRAHKRLPKNQPLFNDVLFKIKTSNQILDPLRVLVSDKEFLKFYVKDIAGDQYNVPYAILRSKESVCLYDFPDRCVIKPTHSSGKVVIRIDGSSLNLKEIEDWFDHNYYQYSREANYKYLQQKVIIEPLVFDEINNDTYNLFCVNGSVRVIQVNKNSLINRESIFLDAEWNDLGFTMTAKKLEILPQIPDNFCVMVKLAEKLSSPFSFIRVDLYSNGKQCFVGELTNCDGSANAPFNPAWGEQVISRILFS